MDQDKKILLSAAVGGVAAGALSWIYYKERYWIPWLFMAWGGVAGGFVIGATIVT